MAVDSAAVLDSEKVNPVDLSVSDLEQGMVDTLALFRGAVAESGCPHKVIAADAGYQPDYWSRVLTGERGLTIDRLGRLPIEVQRRVVALWGRALGLRLERRSNREQARAALQAIAQTILVMAEGL